MQRLGGRSEIRSKAKTKEIGLAYDLIYSLGSAPVFGPRHRPEAEELIRHIDERHRTLLDVGCGEGQNLVFLARGTNGTLSITGIDPSRIAISRAAKRARENGVTATLIRGDSRHKRLGTFDVVASFFVMHHIPHPEAFVCNIVDHLSPGGLLALAYYLNAHAKRESAVVKEADLRSHLLGNGWEELHYAERNLAGGNNAYDMTALLIARRG